LRRGTQSYEGCNAVFVGRHFRTVDEKSRVVLPPAFRRELEADGRQSVVLAPDVDGCVTLMRTDDFARSVEKMKAKMDEPEGRENFRFVVSNAQQLDLDKAGRVNLSEDFRRLTGIEIGGEAAIVGFFDYAEIWEKERFLSDDARVAARFTATGRR